MALSTFKRFVHHEAASGVLLFIAAVIALVLDNSPISVYYQDLLTVHLRIPLGFVVLDKPILMWVNDGLMAVFFLLVGLEIKREMVSGELSSFKQAVLPGLAAVGGMLIPALIYWLFTHHDKSLTSGWAIPTATDIAFSLGVLALLTRYIPTSIKVFLTALAIFDDLGAIVIIAIFYTADLSLSMLLIATVLVLVLVLFNRLRLQRSWPYVLVGLLLWACILKSGVHATLAGIILAWAIPVSTKDKEPSEMITRWEDRLHPWVAYLVLPIFAFANAGIRFADMGWSDLWSGVTLGCIAGLFIGKQLGITTAVWLGVRTGVAELPSSITMKGVYGVALIAGIGFTMSLFIGSLAFANSGVDMMDRVRLGVIIGSLLSGLLGYYVLKRAYRTAKTC